MRPPFEMAGNKPSLFITADYELFLGGSSGSLDASIFTPLERLAGLLERYDRKLTIFVDILMIWRMMTESENVPILRNDVDRIKHNLQDLLKRGHSLQLHLHTQWLDAECLKGRWTFPSYERYSLPQLSADPDAQRWDTIAGCVKRSKGLLDEIGREVISNYSVTAFRAGGLCVQPFAAIRKALHENGLTIDSSVAPGLRHADAVRDYDFTRAPDKDCWRFGEEPTIEEPNGPFEEIPILTFEATLVDKIASQLKRRLSPTSNNPWGDGQGLQASKRLWTDRLRLTPAVLTYDYWPAEVIHRELSRKVQRGWRRLVLLGHPKYLSPYGLRQLEKVLSKAKTSGWA